MAKRIFLGDRPRDISHQLKHDHPGFLVFVQNGTFYEVFDQDARTCSDLFGWKLRDHGTDGTFTGVPINAFRFKEKLRADGKPYIVVLQQHFPAPEGPIARAVHEVFER